MNNIILNQELEVKRINLELELRLLNTSDIPSVRSLCEESFPISYPNSWYEDITSSPKFLSIAAIYKCMIVGILVAEFKSWTTLSKEDRLMLANTVGKNCSVAYILSLGVQHRFRRNGIGSLLLQAFLDNLNNNENHSKVKGCYLHVLSTNQPAILFYEKHNFFRHSFLPFYYSINGQAKDAFIMVTFVNTKVIDKSSTPSHLFYLVKECCMKIHIFNVFTWMKTIARGFVSSIRFSLSKLHLVR